MRKSAKELFAAKLKKPLTDEQMDNEKSLLFCINEILQLKGTTTLLLTVFLDQTDTGETIEIDLNNASEVKGLQAWSELNIGNISSTLEEQNQHLEFTYNDQREATSAKLMPQPRPSASMIAG